MRIQIRNAAKYGTLRKGGETYHNSHEFSVLYPAAEITKLMGEGGPRVWKNISKQPRIVMDYIYTPFIPKITKRNIRMHE